MLKLRHIVFCVALLLALVGDSEARLRHAPRNTPTNQQAAAQDQRGTDQQPLTVKVLPSEKSETDRQQERERRENEIGLTNATWWLTRFTFLLALVGIAQLALFWVQLSLIRKSLGDAKQAADAATKGAKAAELNAEAVIDAARARIFVSIDRDTTDSIRGAAKYVNSPEMDSGTITTNVGLFYSFKNYGNTPAILKEISHQIILTPELEKVRDYAPIVPLPVEHILSPGDKTPDETLMCSLLRKITVAEAKDIQALKNTVWFYGYISYDDTFGFGRELRYVFHYDGSTRGRFSLYSYNEIESRIRHQD